MKKVLLGLLGVVVLSYGVGYYYFSNHIFPNTTINEISCGRNTFKEAKSKLDSKTKDYSISLEREGEEPVVINNKDVEVAKNPITVKEIKDLQSKYRPLWFVKAFDNYTYNLKDIAIEESTIEDFIKDNKVLHPEKKTKAENAKLKYDEKTKQYKIIKEKVGNTVIDEKLLPDLKDAIDKRKETLVLEDKHYKQPKYTHESEKVLKAQETLNKYLSTTVHYQSGEKELTLDADKIHDFLCWNKDFKYYINDELVKEYVKSTVMPKFGTVGRTKTVKTKKSGKIKVSGGNFGYQVGPETETKHLLKDLKKGEVITREPEYYLKGSDPDNEIGDTYIDIDIGSQMLYYIKNNKVKLTSEVVTGNTSTGHGTPTGLWHIEYKQRNHTMVKYNAFVRYWMPIDTGSGVGLHDADWRGAFGGSIYRSNGSHGCINMPPSKAGELYNMVSAGTPVVVHY